MKRFPTRTRSRGYTLIEALVASSILLIGIAAASSMSLALVTQEEMNERSVKAINYLDNAVRLYQLGVEIDDIKAILPEEPLVTSMTSAAGTVTVTGIGNIPSNTLTLTYKPSVATSDNSSSEPDWTGGEKDVTRSVEVTVIRSSSYLTETLPRVEYVKNNP